MSDQLTKRCRACGETKPLSEFYVMKWPKNERYVAESGHRPECKECWKAKRTKYRDANRKTVTDAWRASGYKRYGITLADWDKMYVAQGGCCAICGKHQSELTRRLHVDHCHATGEVRGLLCGNCNTAIGKLEEDPKLFNRAMEYLGRHSDIDRSEGNGPDLPASAPGEIEKGQVH